MRIQGPPLQNSPFYLPSRINRSLLFVSVSWLNPPNTTEAAKMKFESKKNFTLQQCVFVVPTWRIVGGCSSVEKGSFGFRMVFFISGGVANKITKHQFNFIVVWLPLMLLLPATPCESAVWCSYMMRWRTYWEKGKWKPGLKSLQIVFSSTSLLLLVLAFYIDFSQVMMLFSTFHQFNASLFRLLTR